MFTAFTISSDLTIASLLGFPLLVQLIKVRLVVFTSGA
jgi:hypothetical protein